MTDEESVDRPEPTTIDTDPPVYQFGLAFGVLKFVAIIAFFGIGYATLDLIVPSLFTASGPGLQAQGAQLTDTQGYVELAWEALPFIALMGAAVFLIARAAFESRGGV
jgi:hypothetical protein